MGAVPSVSISMSVVEVNSTASRQVALSLSTTISAMVRSASKSSQSGSSRSSCAKSYSRVFSLDIRRPMKRCSCGLINETQLKEFYLNHAQSTDGLWHGPQPVAEWKDRFLPSSESTSSELNLDAVPDVHDAIALVSSSSPSHSISSC